MLIATFIIFVFSVILIFSLINFIWRIYEKRILKKVDFALKNCKQEQALKDMIGGGYFHGNKTNL